MEGILWQQTVQSLGAAGILLVIIVPLFAIIIIVKFFLVDKRVKKNCSDCFYANKSQGSYITCTVKRSAIDLALSILPPKANIKGNALYIKKDGSDVAILMRCPAWRWDGVYRNLKKSTQQLMEGK